MLFAGVRGWYALCILKIVCSLGPIVLLFLQKWSHVQCFQGRYETNTLNLWRFRYKRNNSDDVIMIPTSRTKLIDFCVIYISISRSWIFKLCPVMIQTVHGTEFTKALTLDWLIPFLSFLPARLLFYTWVFTDPYPWPLNWYSVKLSQHGPSS